MEEDGCLNILSESSDSENNCLEQSFDLDIISEVLGLQHMHMPRSDSPVKTFVERVNDSCSNMEWVKREVDLRIEAFSDLNPGERNFYKLWNRHILSLGGVGGTHMSAVVLRFVETRGIELLEQNLYRNFTAHLAAMQKLNIVGADTFLRNILNFAPLSTFYLILINLKHHSNVLHVTLKMSPSAISHLQKKIITSSTMSHLESSWQNMRGRSLNTSSGLNGQEDDGTQTTPERSLRDENANTRVLNSRSSVLMNLLFSKRITNAGAMKVLKEFQEDGARTSRILKEGLRHPAVLKEKESWTRISVVS